jgi:hypothetical protein
MIGIVMAAGIVCSMIVRNQWLRVAVRSGD